MLGQYTSERFDLPNSVVIGDRLTDVQLAKNLGCKAVWFTGKQNVIQLEEHPELKDSVLYISNDWNDIACFLLGDGRHLSRQAIVTRVTKETQIELSVNLDGTGNGHITTGIGFFDHMLEQIVKHTGFDVELHAHGDLAVDEHHTVEDVAITLGEAVLKALGDKRGISRYGCELLPMDDVLAQCAIDFSGRPDLVWEGEFKREYVGSFPTEMVRHFFKSFSDSSRCNLNLKVSDGNAHHQIEALFKAFSHAMRQAVRRYYWSDGLPSTKGVL
jgi:imidazoleglycerol-phosphate dehydratase/histidinol-phosphatase